MCNKCIKKLINKEIIDTEFKVRKLFDKIIKNPSDYKNDKDLINLLDCMTDNINIYKSIK
jgi:hypothetical protein